MPAENPFVGSDVARRYAQARPDFHAEVVARIAERLPSVRRGLDVGCGTGLSTRPLAKIADVCVGVDVSAEMLSEALARTSPHVYFVAGTAERLPFTDGAFELVTVSSAAHWFDQEAFLTEARRVMRSSGSLVVYDDHFAAQMDGDERFEVWMRESYGQRFPRPAADWFDPERPSARGFRSNRTETREREVPMTRSELVDYLFTHSNTITAVGRGDETEESLGRWLSDELAASFGENPRRVHSFVFRTEIWWFHRSKQGDAA